MNLRASLLVRVLSICTAGILSGGGAEWAEAQNVATVSGVVTDAEGRAVADAQAYLEGPMIGALSDSLGRFEILLVPIGEYRLIVERRGYQRAEREIQVPGAEALEVVPHPARLSAGPCGDAVCVFGRRPHAVLGISVGLASVLGWLGGGLEVYGFGGRASALLGVGYVPSLESGAPSFAAYGAALRRYFELGHHRFAAEASVSLVSWTWASQAGVLLEHEKFYGPGIGAAYRYVAESGLHFDLSLGVGWAVGADQLEPEGGLAIGYTWRR